MQTVLRDRTPKIKPAPPPAFVDPVDATDLSALVSELSRIYDQTITPRGVREHYDAELRRIKLSQEKRDLIPSDEVRLTMAGLIKRLMIAVETLPDVLERDAGIGAAAVERVREVCDRERETLYEALLSYAE